MGTKTPEEIAHLKSDWYNDPIYDLETVEGFEAHRGELLAYRLETERRWETERLLRESLRREEMRALSGCGDNERMLAFFIGLSDKIKQLEKQVEDLRFGY